MIEKFNEYRYIKKSKSELEADKIVHNITNKLWNDASYTTIYNLGAVGQLKVIAQCVKRYGSIDLDTVLKVISTYKESEGVSGFVDAILEEFDYKENDK